MTNPHVPGDLADRLSAIGVQPAEQRRLALPEYDFPSAQEVAIHAFRNPSRTIEGTNKFNLAESRNAGAWLLLYKSGGRREVLLDSANRWENDEGILRWDQAAEEWVEFTEQKKVARAIPLKTNPAEG